MMVMMRGDKGMRGGGEREAEEEERVRKPRGLSCSLFQSLIFFSK